jgi:hypothetical protein
MLASGLLLRGLSMFWSPNMEQKEREHITIPAETLQRWHKKQNRKKFVRCKKMQALQRSLSEAQKIGFGDDVLIKLIRIHKANCIKCQPNV